MHLWFFCHNDLLGPNIICNKQTEIQFIDYEYANYNYRAFDIANHFNEWAGYELDYSHYPNKEEQYQFFKCYLKAYKIEATEQDLRQLYVEVNNFALASHFFWAIWALVQAKISDIEFDFLQYGIDRLKEYFRTKDERFNLIE